MKLDTVEIAKEAFKDKDKLIIDELPEDKVKIWYKNKRMYRKIGGTDPRPFILPMSINLDEEFAEAVGLYLGDGKTTENDAQHLEFSNKDPDIIIFMLDFFIYRFLVSLDRMTISIKYRHGSEIKILEKWSSVLKIPEDKFKISYQSRNRHDTVSIQINSAILRKMFIKIISESLQIIKSDKLLRRGFLRGYFAAEGNIGFKGKDNYLEYIGFSYNASKETYLREFCISCLNLEGIEARYKEDENEGLIYINKWKNYYKLWLIKMFDRCERKKIAFQKILFTREIYCDLNDGFRIKLLTSGLTQDKVAKMIDSWQSNICRTIEGKHLLRLYQIKTLSEYHKISNEEMFNNIIKIRIGNMRSFIYDKTLLVTNSI
ncbi:MAG: LAGLIDADG family homing endonuclease [Candidatus Aenigmarchaeota archaeon]|nr:LAGLIDADG family homing endonuclease [Candidatus Aenigmarchaeota archaeon]